MTPEGKVKADVKKYLDSIGAYHFWPVQTGMGATTLDCLACIPFQSAGPRGLYRPVGRFWAIETKRPSGRATGRQNLIIGRVGKAHGMAVVIDDVETLVRMVEGDEEDR